MPGWERLCHGGLLPVFVDDGRRLGVGRGRRIVSQVLGWVRAGNDHLALVTNGRQWRLLFAGLDYDAWCEWDLDLWFEDGSLSPQVTALRTLLSPALWTPGSEDDAPPLLQAIRDTRKGQAELSEVLGERVREAVEILISGHGDAVSVLAEGPEEADIAEYRAYLEDVAGVSSAEVPFGDDETLSGVSSQDIYRAACRVAMRLVVILFAESRELLPRDNALYHESYGLNGLLEQLERGAARGSALATSFGAWPRVLGTLPAGAGRLPSPGSAGDPLNNKKNQNRFTIARGRENSRLHVRWREARSRGHGFGDPSKIQESGGNREIGIEAFLTQNHGEGWMVPETLRLADYGLGHDERARHPQPVASRLGPRFYDWQLVQRADESWRECHLHARNPLGTHGYGLLLVEQIERRAANGEDYFSILADRFTRELLGDDGYATALPRNPLTEHRGRRHLLDDRDRTSRWRRS